MNSPNTVVPILFGIVLLIMTAGAFSEPESGFLASPFHTIDTWRVTAAFDLDRSSGSQADWTGWKNGDPTAGYGHA